ncbi:MAG TPA: hypothetical protein VFT69_05325 [Pseudolabrys sp.]|jgi:hypothetical protein|nr:hypothetical protein [Pseudolabrys sp.]
MATITTTEKLLIDKLQRSLVVMSMELDRLEILTAALATFSRPVPEYEPYFRHVDRLTLGVQELGRDNSTH